MEVNVLRDFVIVIGGFLLIFLVLVLGLLGFLLYRQIKSLSASIKTTTTTAREMGTEIQQALKSTKDLGGIFKSEKSGMETKPPVGTAG